MSLSVEDVLAQVEGLLNPEQQGAVLKLIRTLATERDELASEREAWASERDELTARVQDKESEISRLRRLLFGRKSERLTREELGQLVFCYGTDEANAASDDPHLPVPALTEAEPEEGASQKKRNGHRGRTRLAPELERKVTTVAVPEDERTCQACGTPMVAFGHVDHERVEYVPAKLVVHVERREKLGCKACKCDAITAERPSVAEVPALRVGASLLAHLIESKCDDALPIHRQCDQLARLGFELPASTAYGYWKYATSLLLPISDALLGTVQWRCRTGNS